MIYRIKKAVILPLDGKYYGTKVKIYFEDDRDTIINIWSGSDWKPSERERISCQECDFEFKDVNPCYDCFCDSHYETENDYNLAKIICDALNALDFI